MGTIAPTDQTGFDAEFNRRRYNHSVTQTLPQFWARFGGLPDVAGKHVLDFGCARGGMVHTMLEAGAKSACGIDINPDYIAFAKAKHADQWGDKAQFVCGDIREQSLEPADIITSCNVMEHVLDLRETLAALVNHAKPGGDLFIGFSPLWHSPFGHHRLIKTRRPWAHLARGNRAFLDRLVDDEGNSPETIQELGFNGATPADFRSSLKGLPVEIVSARRNVATHPLKQIAMKALLLPSAFSALEKYVTIGIYWHLRRTK
ncbi:class I SAM-dependent methyltransferase [Qipengyuania sp. S6317L1]|uniref:class I SAM-dependent methyltransferase n=1 Tax=Qipengyuania sp. S6317L1 TaxID=2926410 RepID=UPI001FF2751A|nr:class I SAM-dependent methyltransferase [Qipengyuania sp. S6317L1]MCK0098020.1 class I SAM-dependent methyltransferase [Qipengyuania sp. S6317L1]